MSEGVSYKRMTGDCEITSLCADKENIKKGCLFFCYRGVHCDLHGFASLAEEKGAAAIVCEKECEVSIPQLIVSDARAAMSYLCAKFYGNPQKKLKMIGVTGTNGKTTVSGMIASVLAAWGKRVGLIGTLGAGLEGKEYSSVMTTPDPIDLYRILAQMKEDGAEYVVMEVSAHALALKKVLPIVYEAGIFTNLSRDHLDFFGDMKEYGKAKEQLFLNGRSKCAILNADDETGLQLSRSLSGERITFGMKTPADVFAVVEEESLRGSRILVNYDEELCDVRLSVGGDYNISNALAAITACRKLGADMTSIAVGMEAFKGAEGRLEWVGEYHGGDIFVDYAHTPDGLKEVLKVVKRYAEGRVLLLFGCGGNRDRGKRKEMGKVAAEYADFTFLTSDNPRYEDSHEIIRDIEEGMDGRYLAVEDRKRATKYALDLMGKGDILLIAGKGGECYQEIMGIKYPYRDKDVILRYIGKLS